MTQIKHEDAEEGSGFFSEIKERAKDMVSGIVEFEDETETKPSTAPVPVSHESYTPPTPNVAPIGGETLPAIPNANFQDSDIAPDSKIKRQIEALLRQSPSPEIQAVIQYEKQYAEFSMISDPVQRRAAVLKLCNMTVEQLVGGYQSMLNLLSAERLNDQSFVESKISELVSQNSSKQEQLRTKIRNNKSEADRLMAENESLTLELDSLDSRVDQERKKYERGGAVFQVTADMVQKGLETILKELK